MTPLVTIGIAAQNSERFVGDALRSACAQTCTEIRIVVSVDLSDDATVAVALAAAAGDRRVSVVAHERRLGWIDNFNWLIDRVDSEYFVLLPGDDRLDPGYVARLLGPMNNPDVVAAQADLLLSGQVERVFPTGAFPGLAVSRVVRFLEGRPNGSLLRALTRTSAGVRLRPGPLDGLHADTAYALELVTRGEIAHLPQPLYRKTMRPDSLHVSWRNHEPPILVDAWLAHHATCLGIIDEAGLDDASLDTAREAYLRRARALVAPDGQLHALLAGDTDLIGDYERRLDGLAPTMHQEVSV